jgi:hypothetical protein
MVESPHQGFGIFLRCTLAAALLAGCAREDEELHRQVVELRADVQAKNRELEELRAKAANTSSQTPTAPPSSNAELTKAQARIGELEGEVAKLNAKLNDQAKSQPEPATSISMKFDADSIKDKLENDLTRKASELRDLVLRQSGITSISEISIKRVELPPEVITPFHSAITFTLLDNGKPLRVQFPVTADFGGSWRLPSPDKIQQACQQAREQMAAGTPPAPPPAESPGASPAPATPSPAPARTVASQSPSTNRTPSMRRVDSNTFVMDWGDKPAAAPAQSPSATPSSSAPAPGSGLRTPSGQGAAPAPASPNVPPPVMPVQRDIIIKF